MRYIEMTCGWYTGHTTICYSTRNSTCSVNYLVSGMWVFSCVLKSSSSFKFSNLFKNPNYFFISFETHQCFGRRTSIQSFIKESPWLLSLTTFVEEVILYYFPKVKKFFFMYRARMDRSLKFMGDLLTYEKYRE